MSGGQTKTPVRGQAQPGHNNRFAIAAGNLSLAKNHRKRQLLGAIWAAFLAIAARFAP